MVTHAHMLGSRSSGGPVIRYPQQQKVLRAGHTMYERSMVFGCGGAALLVALSARARSTNPADGGGVQGGAFGLLGVLGVLGMAARRRRPRQRRTLKLVAYLAADAPHRSSLFYQPAGFVRPPFLHPPRERARCRPWLTTPP